MDIREAQLLIKRRYYERDRERGLYKTFTWMIEEVGELAEALLKGGINELEEEIADVFAWLLSVANILGVDVEESFKKKYVEN
ncbi:MAG: nucleotide pyrophosphohydrolase [Desulfurococcales archaeon]|nr:nucleotide pyrophosphohydrolase [Desulfurococcales archaeon]